VSGEELKKKGERQENQKRYSCLSPKKKAFICRKNYIGISSTKCG
jgi:hypothetical protein